MSTPHRVDGTDIAGYAPWTATDTTRLVDSRPIPPVHDVTATPVATPLARTRRTISVRLAAAIAVVALLVGVGLSLLVGTLTGPAAPGATPPGPPPGQGQLTGGTGTST